MSRQQQAQEYESWMFHTYMDFAEVIKSEGIHNVLEDLEGHQPEAYAILIQGVLERAKINKDVPCALLRKGD